MKNNLSRLIILLACCLVYIFSVFPKAVTAQTGKSDRQELHLRGAVKKMEIVPSPDGPGLKDIYMFNEAGNITEKSTVYRNDLRAFLKTVNTYDKAGRKISTEYFREEQLKRRSTFQSDARGNLIGQKDFLPGGQLISVTAFKYDDRGNLIEQTDRMLAKFDGTPLPAGSAPIEFKTIYRLDENADPDRIQSFFWGEKTAAGDQGFVYNQAHQPIESREITPTFPGKPPRIQRSFYRYNEQGDLTESRSYESIKESNVEEIKDRFKVVDERGTVQNGLLVSDKPFMILWSISVCRYEYDAQQNWIKQSCQWRVRDLEVFAAAPGAPLQRIFTYF